MIAADWPSAIGVHLFQAGQNGRTQKERNPLPEPPQATLRACYHRRARFTRLGTHQT